MIFKQGDEKLIVKVLDTFKESNITNSPTANKQLLKVKRSKLDAQGKELLDKLLSFSIQVPSRRLSTRFNTVVLEPKHLELANEYLDDALNYSPTMVISSELPLELQQLLQYVCDFKKLKMRESDVLLLIENLVVYVKRYKSCKRCGTEVDVEDICASCDSKLYEAVQFRDKDFMVSGSSLEGFQRELLDWRVRVRGNIYFFTRLRLSKELYQPGLPFKEFQNTLQLM